MWSVLFSELFDLVNLVQSRDLPRAIREKSPCSCGAPVAECGLVSDAALALLPGGNRREFFAQYLQDRFGEERPDVIDSSKSVRHLLLLRSLCEVKPVVIVFDRPQAEIARSWEKRGKDAAFLRKITLRNRIRMLALNVLSLVGTIELVRFDFHQAIQDPVAVLREFGRIIGKERDIADDQRSFPIRWERQYIFPPADPEYVTKRTDIEVKSRQ